ncbi:Tll0287-like domain-containing protein [Litorilituus lipolyticus]|uniref:DUF3365 domain-containing protein n=1 Tax=Litorilituus lipolyticus TaxID=2491017 RepID=A0A502KPA5_9GAMM|nr:DUF3365 domain-containing protein [Litorilituus lipolyticus]TPH13452.1 DUF3365 domain-containing protein [Litorilituus lipolyticus]
MKHSIQFLIPLTIFSLLPIYAHAHKPADEQQLTSEAKKIVKSFGGTLKPKLKQAIQSGGLVHAIDVCAIEAPKIAKKLSQKTQWDVSRVSLKTRNAKNATANNYEQKILQQFAQQKEQANTKQTANSLEHAEIVNNEFRFMKAQLIEGVCLNCHGNTIAPEVKQALQKHYPNDMATGYSLGDVRGAFSLVKKL